MLALWLVPKDFILWKVNNEAKVVSSSSILHYGYCSIQRIVLYNQQNTVHTFSLLFIPLTLLPNPLRFVF